MATSLADLLDETVAVAARATPGERVTEDARLALGQLGSALHRLVVDGIDSVDGGDPERTRWVRELGQACAQAGQPPIVQADAAPGRLAQLAGAATDTVGLSRWELTTRERWAITAAIVDTAHHLTGLADGLTATPAAARTLVVVDAASIVVSRFAAVDPPSAQHSAVLDRPIPDPFPTTRRPGARVTEAMAGLLHATRPGTGPHSVATLLAVSIGAETLCAVATTSDSERASADSGRAATSWANVRVALAPFNDGSRRPHNGAPPTAVSHALTLHRALESARSTQMDASPAVAPDAVRGLPILARQMDAAVLDVVRNGRLFAYACDLPMRESRVGQYLAGHGQGGLIVADELDILEVAKSLRRAENLGGALAKDIDGRTVRPGDSASRPVAREPEARRDPQPAAGPSERSLQERSDAAAYAAARTLAARPMSAPPR